MHKSGAKVIPDFCERFLSFVARATALVSLDHAAQTPHPIPFSLFATRGAK